MLTRSYCKLFCILKRHNIHQSQRSAIHDRGGEHVFKLYRLYLINYVKRWILFIRYWFYIYWYLYLTVYTNILNRSLFQHYRFKPCSVLYTGKNLKSLQLKFRNGSKKLQKYMTGTFIILYFTVQLSFSVFKYNCGIKKFEKIMVNKCPYIEFTR